MSLQAILALLLPTTNLESIPLEFDIYYTLNGESIGIGDTVAVDTLCYGSQQPGVVVSIVPNPFYGQGGMCAFVVSTAPAQCWTEYLPVEIEVYQ